MLPIHWTTTFEISFSGSSKANHDDAYCKILPTTVNHFLNVDHHILIKTKFNKVNQEYFARRKGMFRIRDVLCTLSCCNHIIYTHFLNVFLSTAASVRDVTAAIVQDY